MGFISMTKPCKLVEKTMRMLNASWNSAKKRAKAGSLSHIALGPSGPEEVGTGVAVNMVSLK